MFRTGLTFTAALLCMIGAALALWDRSPASAFLVGGGAYLVLQSSDPPGDAFYRYFFGGALLIALGLYVFSRS